MTPMFLGPVDVEKQCGVLLPNGQPCARSLTCKSHSMGAKRAVAGRSLPYDMLLAAYQKKNQAKQQSKSWAPPRGFFAWEPLSLAGSMLMNPDRGGAGCKRPVGRRRRGQCRADRLGRRDGSSNGGSGTLGPAARITTTDIHTDKTNLPAGPAPRAVTDGHQRRADQHFQGGGAGRTEAAREPRGCYEYRHGGCAGRTRRGDGQYNGCTAVIKFQHAGPFQTAVGGQPRLMKMVDVASWNWTGLRGRQLMHDHQRPCIDLGMYGVNGDTILQDQPLRRAGALDGGGPRRSSIGRRSGRASAAWRGMLVPVMTLPGHPGCSNALMMGDGSLAWGCMLSESRLEDGPEPGLGGGVFGLFSPR